MYVGDAAGRDPFRRMEKGSNRPPESDFSDSDLNFALNGGYAFQTPDQFFLNKTEAIHCQVRPKRMRLCDMPVPTPPNPDIFTSTVKGQREIVLLVAPPGTGKSTLARRFQGYTIVNQDTLKTLEKCKQRAQDALVSQRVSVVVDNTNMEQKTRQEWITLAQRLQVTIRAVQLQTPDLSHMKCLCTSLAEYRQFSPLTPPHDVRDIPSIVFNTYFPTKSTPTKTWPSETSETHPNPSLPSLNL